MIATEVVSTPEGMRVGLQSRDALMPGAGLLFVHKQLGLHHYWTYRVLFPIDIVWIGANGRIVDIRSNVPPCGELPCPSYGPAHPSRFVLELGAGEAERNGMRIGQRLEMENAA